MTDTTTKLDEAAFAVWRAKFPGQEPTEPLRSRGGALDPAGYGMRVAIAVADGTPPPNEYRDRPPNELHVRLAREALDA